MSHPETQYAVQLVGPGELKLNPEKPVFGPGPYQILAKTEAVGLCYSDMKLLKQFDAHVRKSDVLEGIDLGYLREMPNYVPGDKPTVPGHEVVCRILEVGSKVVHYKVGERWLIQADYRALKTAGSNGAFGYNFEGALQEYILLDERVIGDPNREDGYMIRADEQRASSQMALVEPWACVENSYVNDERQTIRTDGRTLIVADMGRTVQGLEECWNEPPTEVVAYASRGQTATLDALPTRVTHARNVDDLADESFDDIVYFGSHPEMLELLNDKLAKGGILNLVLSGQRIGRKVEIGVGRIHYGGTRWVGTVGEDPSESYAMIPATGEVQRGNRALIVGAGGPMGQMHVIRSLAMGATVVAVDVDAKRLETLAQKVGEYPGFQATTSPEGEFEYIALMAPIPALVEDAIEKATPGGIVNVFAGIPAPTKYPIDLDTLVEKRVFVFGTSGSEPRDMRLVLHKVVEGTLDTNVSVAAVSGMAGAIEGLHAVDNRTMDGKIIVYPELHDMPLIPLEEMENRYPSVAAKLRNGRWCKEAEEELLRVAHS